MTDKERKNRIIAGIILLVMSVGFLVWHEIAYFHNKSARSYMEDCVVLDKLPDSKDPSLEGKLVYLSGKLTSYETYTDPNFGCEFQVPRLNTSRYYYQVRETEHKSPAKTPDGRDTVDYSYTYSAEWVDHEVTAEFHDSDVKNENTVWYKYFYPTSFKAGWTYLGPYAVSEDLLKELPDKAIPVPEISKDVKNKIAYRILKRSDSQSADFAIQRAAEYYASKIIRQKGSYVYVSLKDGETDIDELRKAPNIGDICLHYQGVPQDTVSLIARVRGMELIPDKYDKRPVSAIFWGVKPAQDVVSTFYKSYRGGTYTTIRLLLLALIFGGLALLLEKSEHFMAKTPFFALAIFMFTMAIPWLFHKWFIGLLLILGAGISLFIYYYAFDRFYKMIAGVKDKVVDTDQPTDVKIEPDKTDVDTFDLE